MSIMLYNVKDRKIIPTEEIKLESDKIYIIIDTHMKRSKIWIWSGFNSSIRDRYYAGVSATKIKSQQKLYGASIEVVDEGNEPENFPILSEDKVMKAIEIEEIAVEEKDEIIQEQELDKIDTKIVEKKIPQAERTQTDRIRIEKLKNALKEISLSLENVVVQINNLMEDL
ncbi:MAG: hypothetical protein ACTSR8_07580 [Promethearchaeota archaeon]